MLAFSLRSRSFLYSLTEHQKTRESDAAETEDLVPWET